MSKIDRQLESIADEALFPTKGDAPPAVRTTNAEKQRRTSTLGVVARLVLATALAVGVAIWPYDHGCGLKLVYYLVALSVVTGAGVWSAIWSWRHHSGRAHILSLALVAYGLILGAGEVLPRVGYATPTLERPAVWGCE
jgi:cytochrome bd-type quinol oxidase subunit 2